MCDTKIVHMTLCKSIIKSIMICSYLVLEKQIYKAIVVLSSQR